MNQERENGCSENQNSAHKTAKYRMPNFLQLLRVPEMGYFLGARAEIGQKRGKRMTK
jgi:hypothetical protein